MEGERQGWCLWQGKQGVTSTTTYFWAEEGCAAGFCCNFSIRS